MSGACGRTIHRKTEQCCEACEHCFDHSLKHWGCWKRRPSEQGDMLEPKRIHGANLLHQQLCKVLGIASPCTPCTLHDEKPWKKRKAKLHRSLVGGFELSSWHDVLQTHVINYMQLQCLSIIGIQICKHTSQWNHPQGQGFSLAQVDAFAMSLLHLNVGPFHDQPCVQFKDLTWWCFGLPGRHLISSNIYADSHGPTFKMVCQHPNLVRIHHDITR